MKKKLLFLLPLSAAVIACLLYILLHRHPDTDIREMFLPTLTPNESESSFASEPPSSVLRLSDLEADPAVGGNRLNPHTFLNVPTQMTKIGDDYFLVDCYHDQVITSTDPNAPLSEWLVVTDQINKGHTIAGDGTVYLVDDTENHRILIFEKKDGLFCQTQSFSDIGIRPHYVTYDEKSQRFYALSSMTGELFVFLRNPGQTRVALEKIMTIPELNGYYVRSFTIDKDSIYFISGNSSIIKASLADLTIEETWPVPANIGSMIQLTKIQDYYYITVSTDIYGDQSYATLLRVSDLDLLAQNDWEDIYDIFVGGGTPYYITFFDEHYYLTEHRVPGHSVWEFDVTDNQITNVRAVY